ncbi:PDR/VanB family oxidoreductase [Variovorax sp. J22G21]|uniref:PDR/VanB family oxidoreductase n=1 Tax=Variovorax fucosicus TaxID=3053517 RepID=UPI0025790462|nr:MULTISPECIES: PDR/VanB family oxidoreductase [unclassified Variovorax]MDM0040545.1 PDR/VanB family oxidoreductase [Variovorax sp. J22R193]MDM0061918.1 PDR/VanB family oxidoreductase [Variovorax sp. J22G21]
MQSSTRWRAARVEALRDITPTVREFTLRPQDADDISADWSPGSHIEVELLREGRPIKRSYSLVGQPDGECFRIAVKRLDQGQGGSRAMWQLAVGDRLQVNGPRNHFGLDLNAPAYLLVAGGIGITPMLHMAQHLQARAGRAPLRMVYGAHEEVELAYRPLLRELLGESFAEFVASEGRHIDIAAEIAALPAGGQMYVCGPVPMLDAVRRQWAASGRPVADLRYETFGSSGRFAPQPFRVQVPRQGVDIVVPADSSMMDALHAVGVQTLHDCKRGECGLCAVEVLALDGEIDHRDVFLSEHEKAGNQRICTCVSRVVGSIAIDSAYRPDAD